MTNRVLLNNAGLKVSAAGVNVLTAGIADLLFSSDYAQLGLYATGQFTVGFSDVNSPQTKVTFGKTFRKPPMVIFYAVSGAQRFYLGGPQGYSYTYDIRLQSDQTQSYGRDSLAVVSTTGRSIAVSARRTQARISGFSAVSLAKSTVSPGATFSARDA